MQLTKEQLLQNAEAMKAFAEKLPIQYLSTGKWEDVTADDYWPNDWHLCSYRPKPEPKTRPWSKPEDVPGPVCWLRGKSGSGINDVQRLVTIITSADVSFTHGGSVKFENLEDWEYSTDRREWKPCVVTEP